MNIYNIIYKNYFKHVSIINFFTKGRSDEPPIGWLHLSSEDNCLAIYELDNFKFLLGITIFYNVLFIVNSSSKTLQSKDMNIDAATDQLGGLALFLKIV